MSNNTSNDFLKKMSDSVLNNTWMNELYASDKTKQQEKLKKIFVSVSDNNLNSAQKAKLIASAETLQDKIERLEAKMAVLAEELSKNEEIISKHADEITDLITSVESKSAEMEEKQKSFVKRAVSDVFYLYENDEIGKDAIAGEIRRRIEGSGIEKKYGNEIAKLLGNLNSKQNEVSNLVNEASKWIDHKKILQSQYGATKTAYELLNKNISQIGTTETNFTNSDFDSKKPVYSLAKVAIASDLTEQYSVPASNTAKEEGATAITKESVTSKYSQYFSSATSDGKFDPDAVSNLGKALDEGLFNDFASANFDRKEISEFFVQNFAGASIKYDSKGNLSIPNGNNEETNAIFDKLNTSLTSANSFEGTLNTWDNVGNTIDTNPQMQSLQNFIADGKLQELGEGNPKFTFKEAMYLLFNADTGLFKDCGVEYNLDTQDEIVNYKINSAGDSKTAQMYNELSTAIFDIWGVQFSKDLSTSRDDSSTPEIKTPVIETPTTTPLVSTPVSSTTPAPKPSVTDPIWFKLGNDENSKYTFVIDRDNDDTFSDKSEFVGASGKTWLEDLKSLDSNSDGKLTGDELKELKILNTKYTDDSGKADSNLEYRPDETKLGSNQYFRESTTNVQYGFANAESMGIEEIDLTNLENQVNQSTGKKDINDSEIYNDSFSFKMNGQDVTAHRQDETSEFMETVYSDAYGKNFELKISNREAQDVIDKNYAEYEEFDKRYFSVMQDINILKNAGQAAQQAQTMYNETRDRIDKDENVELRKAANKAASFTQNTGWYSMQSKVAQIAAQEGISIDMEQAKGIYVLDSSLDANGIVKKYKSIIEDEQSIKDEKSQSKVAWASIIECAKNGIECDMDEILSLLKNKDATSAKEVVEILKEKYGSDEGISIDLGALNSREDEIFEEFNKVFNSAGASDKLVEGLYQLVKEQMENDNFMINKSGNELAQKILKIVR